MATTSMMRQMLMARRATLLDISFPLASPERTKSREKEPVEFIFLSVRKVKGEYSVHDNGFQFVLPFHAQSLEGIFKIAVITVELVLPMMYGRHVVEYLAGKEPVLGSGNQWFHL